MHKFLTEVHQFPSPCFHLSLSRTVISNSLLEKAREVIKLTARSKQRASVVFSSCEKLLRWCAIVTFKCSVKGTWIFTKLRYLDKRATKRASQAVGVRINVLENAKNLKSVIINVNLLRTKTGVFSFVCVGKKASLRHLAIMLRWKRMENWNSSEE